jgi:parallel beta-helix repeat protein
MPLASFTHLVSFRHPRRRAVAVAALLLMALVAAQLVRPPLARSATTRTFVAKADTYVDSGQPRTNFGRATSIRTDQFPSAQRNYLRFDTPGLHGQYFKRATLRLFSNRANRLGVAVYSLRDNSWGETSLTWDGSPPPGAFVGHSLPTLAGRWTEIDVTAAVRSNGAMRASGHLSLVVGHSPFANRSAHAQQAHEAETGFASRETGATAPQLVVITEPAPTLPPPSTTPSVPSTGSTLPPSTVPRPTTTVVTPPPPANCVAVHGSVQGAVNANPAGTRFCLSGTINEKITPKDGQVFVGPAVLDGRGSIDRAFVGGATNVTVQNLEVRNYNPGRQSGAIEPGGDNWTLRNVNIHNNGWGGIYIGGNNVKIIGGKVNDHTGLGIGDSKVSGTLVDGTEIARNGSGESCGFEAGGLKFVGVNTTVRNTFTHGNFCKGLWWDINAANTLIEGNLIEDNWDEGIFYEISQDAVIRSNTIRRNGLHNYNAPGRNGCSWLWGGGITIPSSFNVEIYANTLEGNCNGITGTQQDRTDSTPPAHLLKNLSVHDNIVNGSGSTGVVEDNGANLDSRAITFVRNAFGGGHDFCGTTC